MKKIIAAALAAATVLALAGCGGDWGTSSGQSAENRAARAGQGNLEQGQPVPVFSYSQYRQNMIELESAEAKGIQTTSFIFGPNNTPDPVQVCPSVGVPIPSTASLTNPEQAVNPYQGSVTIGQMDPIGVYMPVSGSGTFVMCVQGDGSVMPVYAEGNVHTVFGPAVWDKATHQVQMTGPASFHFSSNAATVKH
jgi:hypothetical protein